MKDIPFIKYYDIGPYPGVWFGVTNNPGNFKKELNRLGITQEVNFINPGFNAMAHRFINKDELNLIVTFKHIETNPEYMTYGLLVHEAVHVWRMLLDYIGDNCNDHDEIEAYHIQNIAQCLIKYYIDHRDN